jgi:hypothetical protein
MPALRRTGLPHCSMRNLLYPLFLHGYLYAVETGYAFQNLMDNAPQLIHDAIHAEIMT